jgi:transcriptional regulator of acetoin/glycerol metabolism
MVLRPSAQTPPPFHVLILVEAMNKHNGRKAEAARDLGINRSTLYYRLKKYGLLADE